MRIKGRGRATGAVAVLLGVLLLGGCTIAPEMDQDPEGAVRYAARAHGVDEHKAVRVALCESGPDFYADGRYKGAFQQAPEYWSERVARYNARNELKTPNLDINDPMTNSLVSMEMVARGGWKDWPTCGKR